MKTKLYFVRHGESEANLLAVLAGHKDLPLTAQGHAQARRCAELFRHVPLDVIYTSDLTRAVQTAQPHEALHGLVAHRCAELREFDAGRWTGQTYAEIARLYPDMYPRLWEDAFGTLQPPGGESLPSAAERMHAFVLRACAEHAGKTLLFVTHAGIFRVFWGKLMGIAPERVARELPFCPNASYSHAVLEDGVLTPVCYGETAALPR